MVLDTAIGDTAHEGGKRAERVSRYASYYDFGAASGPVAAYLLGVNFNFSLPFFLGSIIMIALMVVYFLDLFPVTEESWTERM